MIDLERCADCGAWQYPSRDACRLCLSDALVRSPHPGQGVALARARVVASDTSVLTILLDDGPHLIAFGDAAPGARVNLRQADALFHAEPAP